MDIKQLNEELNKALKDKAKIINEHQEGDYEIPFSITYNGTIFVKAEDESTAYSVAEKLIRDNGSESFFEYSAEASLEGTEISYEIEGMDDGKLNIDYTNYRANN